VAGCRCQSGCPACTGPRLETGGDAKRLAERLLDLLSRGPAAAASAA
jgi:hypothetical protein